MTKETISKELVEQYEIVRQSGEVNMLGYQGVRYVADEMELYALASLTREEYRALRTHCGDLKGVISE